MPDPIAWWQQAAVIAAVITLLGSLLAIAVNGWQTRTDRKRELFAQAFSAVTDYWEYAYVVRRRRSDQPAEERIRISEQLRETQKQISFHGAWLATEAPQVAEAYRELVSTTRAVIGPQIAEGWRSPAASVDSDMNINGIDRDGLDGAAERYLNAAADHLAILPGWLRRT